MRNFVKNHKGTRWLQLQNSQRSGSGLRSTAIEEVNFFLGKFIFLQRRLNFIILDLKTPEVLDSVKLRAMCAHMYFGIFRCVGESYLFTWEIRNVVYNCETLAESGGPAGWAALGVWTASFSLANYLLRSLIWAVRALTFLESWRRCSFWKIFSGSRFCFVTGNDRDLNIWAAMQGRWQYLQLCYHHCWFLKKALFSRFSSFKVWRSLRFSAYVTSFEAVVAVAN